MALAVPGTARRPLTERPSRRRRIDPVEVALPVQGLALAVLVGRDGSPPWQAARVLAVAAIGFGAARLISHLGQRARGRMLVLGAVPAIAIGVGFVPYLAKDGLSGTSVSAGLLVAAALVSLVGGTLAGTEGRPLVRRLGAGFGVLAATSLIAFVVAPAVAATNVPRPSIGATPDRVGLEYQSVRLTTDDGVDLAAWYIVSRNQAAVVLLHGAGSTRSDVLAEAAVLARHGYGVLLVDARGHGESGGRAMDFGWHGDTDIAAATGYLSGRREVDPVRIGVVGMSMGGEEAIGATAVNSQIRAVVAEGATARTAGDEAWLSDEFGWRGAVQERLERLQDQVTDLLTSASPPVSNREAVSRSGSTRYLLITAGRAADEGHAAAHVAGAAPDRVEIWTVAGAGHTGGLATAPETWEARVIAFLDDALGAERRTS